MHPLQLVVADYEDKDETTTTTMTTTFDDPESDDDHSPDYRRLCRSPATIQYKYYTTTQE